MIVYADELPRRPGWYACRDETGRPLVAATNDPARDAAIALVKLGADPGAVTTRVINTRSLDRSGFTAHGTIGKAAGMSQFRRIAG